ncbi:MAG: zinc metalloprotease HtpX [Pseudomonadota bacterium]
MRPSQRHRLFNLLHSAVLLIGMTALFWAALSSFLGPWFAAAIAVGLVLGVSFMPSAPPSLYLRAYRAQPLTRRQVPELLRILEVLSERAALPSAPRLFYIPSRVPNAFAAGAPGESVICVSDGLLRMMHTRELVGVLAHEVSHIANRDLWIMGLADSMTRITGAISTLGQVMLLVSLPFWLFGFVAVPWWLPLLLIAAPTGMTLLQLALSRSREFDADRGAAELTGDPQALASALTKLERRVGQFWEDLVFPARRIPEPSMLRTHPPTKARIERLKALTPPRRPIEIRTGEPSQVFPAVLRRPRYHWTGVWY